MNQHTTKKLTTNHMLKNLWLNRNLAIRLTEREIIGRYRGSLFGLGWSFFNPLLMLAVYTFVFSTIFKAKWGSELDESQAGFAITLFTGLIIHSLLAEVLNQSPSLIPSNTNYVKKVVFPLEILSVTILGSSIFHAAISFTVLIAALIITNGLPNITILYAPLIIFSIIPLLLGLSWILSSLGVYIKDTKQFISLLTTALMFLSPIFYPVSALPQKFQTLIYINPLTTPVENMRRALIYGQEPDWKSFIIYISISFAIFLLGYIFFQKTKKGFADVL